MIILQLFKMNENLLKTYVVKSQIIRWINQKKTNKYILKRLYQIHLIDISEEYLNEFIKKENLI